jgi:hypothetical protein
MQCEDATAAEHKSHNRPEEVCGQIFLRQRQGTRTPDTSRLRINNEPRPVEIRKLEELLSTKSRKSERYRIGTRSRRVDQLGR